MSERKKNIFKIISSLILCVISLVGICMGTFAWLAENDKVGSSGLDMTIGYNDSLLGVEYYNIDASEHSAYKFIKTTMPKLGKYELLNAKYQLLIKFYVAADVGSVNLYAETETDYFLGDGKHPLLAAAVSDDRFVPSVGTTADGKPYTNTLTSIVSIAAFGSADGVTVTAAGESITLNKLPSTFSSFVGGDIEKTVAPQIALSSVTVAGTYNDHLLYFQPDELNLSKGTKVRVTGGDFEGQEGIFLKVKGARDRRVVVEIQGVIAVAMATIHPDLIEVIK